ncbi:lysylphosphatidylglycerol synthase transmembrane domain-containing protein [Streptomyces sp. Qhu-G9]|nr:lysylphosphatidylglycerol synthase transmembrane domain-containing protein [Streptomyces aurantiacus]WAU83958.1 lysylphosphatidylglycerol synthase transmembrane domain-containing protein [Streptomyces aurantiacus]
MGAQAVAEEEARSLAALDDELSAAVRDRGADATAPRSRTAAKSGPPAVRPHGGGAGLLGRVRARLDSRILRTHFGTIAGVVILTVLTWRLGTGVFLDGLRRIDSLTLLAALGIGVLTTVFSAWRWCVVARGLRLRLPLGPAVADYYRALFLNAALPGGVLGDVHRAVRHGQSAGDVGRGVRAVVLERVAGQVVLAVVGVAVLLTQPSPVLSQTRHLALLLAVVSLCGVVTVGAVRGRGRSPRTSRRRRAVRATLAEARGALLARGSWPGVVISSVVVLAGHVLMFLLAARVAGSAASAAELVPLALLALIAMSLPLNVGGWGPREGVTAWAFGAAGLGATQGLTVAVVYGVLSFAASLPGVAVLVARWYGGLRSPREDGAAAGPVPRSPGARKPGRAEAEGNGDGDAQCESTTGGSPDSDVSSEKYAPKESASEASSSFPFPADALEGRPMTPDLV